VNHKLHAAGVSRLLRARRWAGACVCAESRRERRGVRVFVLALLLTLGSAAATACGVATADVFRPYRACLENLSKGHHEVGTVMWEELRVDARHYGFWSDGNRHDERRVLDVVPSAALRINRVCELLANRQAEGRPGW
jgi:hypothetical protein